MGGGRECICTGLSLEVICVKDLVTGTAQGRSSRSLVAFAELLTSTCMCPCMCKQVVYRFQLLPYSLTPLISQLRMSCNQCCVKRTSHQTTGQSSVRSFALYIICPAWMGGEGGGFCVQPRHLLVPVRGFTSFPCSAHWLPSSLPFTQTQFLPAELKSLPDLPISDRTACLSTSKPVPFQGLTHSAPCSAPNDRKACRLLKPSQTLVQTLQVHELFDVTEKVPRVGGRELDLYMLYRNVTSLGGCERVIQTKHWREAAESFSFPETITSVSFSLRKAYFTFLWDYEQVRCGSETIHAWL